MKSTSVDLMYRVRVFKESLRTTRLAVMSTAVS